MSTFHSQGIRQLCGVYIVGQIKAVLEGRGFQPNFLINNIDKKIDFNEFGSTTAKGVARYTKGIGYFVSCFSSRQ